jgi:hypothetical protein
MVLTADELAEVVAGNPLREVASDPSRLLVAFFINREGGNRSWFSCRHARFRMKTGDARIRPPLGRDSTTSGTPN